jgi:tetratricopeptide (TPR) repeat protein
MAGSWLNCPHCHTMFFHAEEVPPLLCPACKKALALPAEEASEPEWFYIEDKMKYGPVRRARLEELVAAGTIKAADMVLENGTTKWLRAGDVPGLISAAALPAAAAQEPPKESGPQWYYMNNGQQTGPISLEEMKKLIISGRLLIAGNVLPKGSSQWVPVVSVKELFPKAEGAEQPRTPSAPPPLSSPAEKPPPVRDTPPPSVAPPPPVREQPPQPHPAPVAEKRPAPAPAKETPVERRSAPAVQAAPTSTATAVQEPKPSREPPKPAPAVAQAPAPAVVPPPPKPTPTEPKAAPAVVRQAANIPIQQPKPPAAEPSPAQAPAPVAQSNPAPAPPAPASVPESSPAEIIERFERAWMQGRRPELDDALPADAALRRCLLPALVGIDLHCRLNCKEAVRVESYLERYPELGENREATVELIALERQHQRMAQPDVPAQEYLQRFPQYEAELRSRLGIPDSKLVAPSAAPTDESKTQEKVETVATKSGAETAPVPASEPQVAPPRPDYPAIPGHEISGILSQDSQAIVYRAEHVKRKRPAALRVVLSGDTQRLLQEAASASRLHHPNIVELYESGEHEGRPYFSVELADGGTLAQRLNSTPVSPPLAAELAEKLAAALHYAHGQAIVHGNLTPASIALVSDGNSAPEKDSTTPMPLAKLAPKIANFGFKSTADKSSSYLAPEQAAGRTHEIGERTDIHAVGAILYELLTGRPPFKGETDAETVEQVQTQEPVRPSALQPKVPSDLDTICLKCLAKQPAKRYASAQELSQDLGRFLAGKPIEARSTPLYERAIDFAKRKPKAASIIGGAALVLLVFFGGCYSSYRDAQRQKAYANAGASKARDELREATTRADEAQQKLLAAKGEAAAAKERVQPAQDNERQARAAEAKALEQEKAARENEKKAIEESAKLRTALDQGALAWHRLHAEQWEKAGQWTAAAYHLGRLIDLNPTDEKLLVRRGDAFRQAGQWLPAAGDYSRALELKADLPVKDRRDLCLGKSAPIQAGGAVGVGMSDSWSVLLLLPRLGGTP